MTDPLRVVHFLNAFFGGLGAEEAAQTSLLLRDGAVGPGRFLEQILAGHGQIMATWICGDGYFSDHEEEVVAQVRAHLQALKPTVFIAGPPFAEDALVWPAVACASKPSASAFLR